MTLPIRHTKTDRARATTAEAVFMITGLTIGAGILGIPYVVSQVGLVVGLVEIVGLGIVMLLLNLMIGEIAVKVGHLAQLSGFTEAYLGRPAKELLSGILIFRNCGVLLVYIIAEGQALQALFGGSLVGWSSGFWAIAGLGVIAGIERLKKVEKFLSLTVIILLVGASVYALGAFQPANLLLFRPERSLFAYGVILFALHASAAIAEAHAVVPGDPRRFRRAIVFGTLIPVGVYVLSALGVVGALGTDTSQLATIALGQKFGSIMLFAVNSAVALAMTTGFLGLATAFRETLVWDHGWKEKRALLFVLGVPFGLFLSGIRNFIIILNVVGGLFISIEALLLVAAYWRATHVDRAKQHFRSIVLALPVVAVFLFLASITVSELLKAGLER